MYVTPANNGKARCVFLPKEGVTFLHLCGSKAPDDRVFLMRNGYRWRGGHKHLFKAAILEAGLPEAFVFHGLRHTYASQLVQAGMPLVMVARQLGHSNTDTVSRTYGHLSCSSIEEELARRFAPLYPGVPTETERIAPLRSSLQAEHAPDAPGPSWPASNFTLAQGDLLRILRR
ncbi:Tyrosine recombinase XerC [Defluviimonas aquaemixtae]|uniref:Tyrosine recombinase XerC n=2 Tax=Albidovulum aquaemixtae TaxID=1542388 RepID=A0A2R8BLW4_9RHOB|nr:Tyrosine recombinase XerC [Defluviimonas aquaemixtae]